MIHINITKTESDSSVTIKVVAIVNPPRCGDHVHHKPTGEKWVVAYADAEKNDIAWAGWPDGRARLVDCEVIYRCTDAEHASAVELWRSSRDLTSRRATVLRLYGNENT